MSYKIHKRFHLNSSTLIAMGCQITREKRLQIITILCNEPFILRERCQFVAHLGPAEIPAADILRWGASQSNMTGFELFSEIMDSWLSTNGNEATVEKLIECLTAMGNGTKSCTEKIELLGTQAQKSCGFGDDYDIVLIDTFSQLHSFFHPEMQYLFVTKYYKRFDSATFFKLTEDTVLQFARQYCASTSEKYPSLGDSEKEIFHSRHGDLRVVLRNKDGGKFVVGMVNGCVRSLIDPGENWDLQNFRTFWEHLRNDNFARVVQETRLILFEKLLLAKEIYGSDE